MGIELKSEVRVRFSDCDPIGHLNNVKYLEYMLNAREDHVLDNYGFTYEEYMRKTGCTWLATQNEIAYLREVKYNERVIITSKTIEVGSKTSKIELLMKSVDEKTIYAVLWISLIYFNVHSRKAENQPDDVKERFAKYQTVLDQKDFQSRVSYLRQQNKKA